MRTYCFEGSYSVEIAFILPIVLFVVLALVQLCLHLSDRLVMQGILYRTTMYAEDCLRGSINERQQYNLRQMAETRQFLQGTQEREKEETALCNFLIEEEDRLLFSSLSGQDVKIKGSSVKINFQMKSRNMLPLFAAWINRQKHTIYYEAECKMFRPADKTRLSSVILDTGKKLKLNDFGGEENGTGL